MSANQMDLFGGDEPPDDPPESEETIEAAFRRFHEDNPMVYVLLARLARKAMERGRKRIGIGMLFEVVRWEIFLQTTEADFKLNNNFRSRYARLLMEQEPDLGAGDGAFELRELRAP